MGQIWSGMGHFCPFRPILAIRNGFGVQFSSILIPVMYMLQNCANFFYKETHVFENLAKTVSKKSPERLNVIRVVSHMFPFLFVFDCSRIDGAFSDYMAGKISTTAFVQAGYTTIRCLTSPCRSGTTKNIKF